MFYNLNIPRIRNLKNYRTMKTSTHFMQDVHIRYCLTPKCLYFPQKQIWKQTSRLIYPIQKHCLKISNRKRCQSVLCESCPIVSDPKELEEKWNISIPDKKSSGCTIYHSLCCYGNNKRVRQVVFIKQTESGAYKAGGGGGGRDGGYIPQNFT